MREERGIQSEKKGEYTIQISHKRKRSDLMGSKQANEINNNNIKENKADSTGNGNGKARFIFLCEVEEEGYKEAKRKAQREKMERG